MSPICTHCETNPTTFQGINCDDCQQLLYREQTATKIIRDRLDTLYSDLIASSCLDSLVVVDLIRLEGSNYKALN